MEDVCLPLAGNMRKGDNQMKDITLCHPRLQVLAANMVEECRKQGLAVKIGETLRTRAEQDALYAQGRTKPGSIVTNAPGSSYSSFHQWGTAFDIYRNDGQGAYNESGGFFEKAGAVGVSLGLIWGGNWKSIVDKPHFQLADWGSSTEGIKRLYKDPAEFMKTWVTGKAKTGWIEDVYGRWYRHDDGSYTKNDWEKIDGKWYWFNESGYAYRSQWVLSKEKWYYLGEDNAMVTGLQVVDNSAYYFDGTGAMATGKITLETDEKGALRG